MLWWDMSLIGDEGVTAEMVPFPGADATAGLILNRPLDVPKPVYFEANVETVNQVDYPDNDQNWPIMSKRMRDILLIPATPKHRVIDVVFLDDTVPTKERFDGKVPRPGVAVEGFGAIHFLEHIDAMDMEKSTFTPHPDFPGSAKRIQNLVFKDIELPPLFRLAPYSSPLFVSDEARRQLEAAKIRGIKFRPAVRL